MTNNVSHLVHRAVQPELAVPHLSEGSPFINRFLAPEWVTFTQAKPSKELIEVPRILAGPTQFAFDPVYAKHTFACLLRVVRLTLLLLHGDCPMTEVAGGASFKETIVFYRADKVGLLPEYLPNGNLDKDHHNPLLGHHSFDESLARADAVNNIGRQLIHFLGTAYDKFGPGSPEYHDPEDPGFSWQFDRLFAPAAEHGYINSTIPGAASIIPHSLWTSLPCFDSGLVRRCFSVNAIQKIAPEKLLESDEEDMLEPESYQKASTGPSTEPSSPSISPFNSLDYPPGIDTSSDASVEVKLSEPFRRSPTPYPSAVVHFGHASPEASSPSPVDEFEDLKARIETFASNTYDSGLKDAFKVVDHIIEEIRHAKREVSKDILKPPSPHPEVDPPGSRSPQRSGSLSVTGRKSSTSSSQVRYSPYHRK